MTNFGHEQFPNQPLLPVVSQETLNTFDANTAVSLDFFLAGEAKMKEEQPVLLGLLSSIIEAGSRDKLE
jgi:hypothetical protein